MIIKVPYIVEIIANENNDLSHKQLKEAVFSELGKLLSQRQLKDAVVSEVGKPKVPFKYKKVCGTPYLIFDEEDTAKFVYKELSGKTGTWTVGNGSLYYASRSSMFRSLYEQYGGFEQVCSSDFTTNTPVNHLCVDLGNHYKRKIAKQLNKCEFNINVRLFKQSAFKENLKGVLTKIKLFRLSPSELEIIMFSKTDRESGSTKILIGEALQTVLNGLSDKEPDGYLFEYLSGRDTKENERSEMYDLHGVQMTLPFSAESFVATRRAIPST